MCSILLGLMVLMAAGCSFRPGPLPVGMGFPAQIGAPRENDVSNMDAYEQVVVQLMNHLEDGVRVLGSVEDVPSSKRAAGMFIEASGRLVDLRRQMLKINPHDVIPPDIILNYAPRYFMARVETERERSRIKALDPEAHKPLEHVLNRIKEELDQVKKEIEAEDKQESGGGSSTG